MSFLLVFLFLFLFDLLFISKNSFVMILVKADDVTYMVVDNLVRLLSQRDATDKHFLG